MTPNQRVTKRNNTQKMPKNTARNDGAPGKNDAQDSKSDPIPALAGGHALWQTTFGPPTEQYNSFATVFLPTRAKTALTDEDLASYLPYVLVGCRVMHYLRCLYRDSDISSKPPAEIERFLASWLSAYVEPD